MEKMEVSTTVSGEEDSGSTIKMPLLKVLKSAKVVRPEESNNKSILSVPTRVYESSASSSKTLKRCLSAPIIKSSHGPMTTRSAAAAAAAATAGSEYMDQNVHETPKKNQIVKTQFLMAADSSTGVASISHSMPIPRSNPCSREVSPAPMFNIFAPRARRYSASSMSQAAGQPGAPLCMTPRISQLRQEECADVNSREVNHEREVHSTIQMSQSWEDLSIVAESWSCKSDEFSNPLQVLLPTAGVSSCSSPSPTSTRASLRLPYGLSPSPTRRTFATRRSMSPIAMRPSSLGPVKRKFELDDQSASNWNVYSTPPIKKIFSDSRGSSPVCQSPSSICPSPDSGTYDGRITPKLFISKLCTNNNSSTCSSPITGSPPTCASVVGVGQNPISSSLSIDEGISISDNERNYKPQPMSTDLQDEATLMMDDNDKSETSSIGGCSTISIESSSCDSGAKSSASPFSSASSTTSSSCATFHNRLIMDDLNNSSTCGAAQKSFFRQAKKFIVNHDNLPNTIISQANDQSGLDVHSIKVSSSTESKIPSTTAVDSTVCLEKSGKDRLTNNHENVTSVIVKNTL